MHFAALGIRRISICLFFPGIKNARTRPNVELRFVSKRELPRSRAAIQNFIESDEDGLLKIFDALREIAHEPTLYGEKSSPPTIV